MTDCKNLDLARQWADGINAGVPVLAQAGHRAAAEVIRDLPDAWVDADKLRDVVADHHIDMSEELMEALGALLPTPKPRTLADIPPEERAECQWMQAEVDGQAYEGRAVITDIVEAEGKAKTILPSGQQFSFHISIVTPLPELPRMQWPGNEPGNVQVNRMDGLARTGETSPAETSDNRRSSTARTHPESAAPDLAHTVEQQAAQIERVREALHRIEQADGQAQHDWDTKADMLAQGTAMGYSMSAQWLEEALGDTDD